MKYVFDKLTQQILGRGYREFAPLYERIDSLNARAGFKRYGWVS